MTTQFKKGVIELCVIKVISKKDMSAFEIMDLLALKLAINENTIYPLLRRLTNQEILKTYMKNQSLNDNKKYYQITDEGMKYLTENLDEWQKFVAEVNSILGGEL